MALGNEIRHLVDPSVYTRGRDLFERGQATVTDVRRYQTHVNITSTCVGSRGDEYRQNNNLYFIDGRLDMFTSYCTCPYGWQCKHAVAAMLTYFNQDGMGGKASQVVSQWRVELTRLFGEPQPDPGSLNDDGLDLTFVFTYTSAEEQQTRSFYYGYARDWLKFRPARPAKRPTQAKPWSFNDVTLKRFENRTEAKGLRPSHVDAVRKLLEEGFYFNGNDGFSFLRNVGADVLDALRACHAAGIAFVEEATQLPLVTHFSGARATISVVETGDVLQVSSTVALPDAVVVPTMTFGLPSVGCAWRDAQGVLNLAFFDEPATAEWDNLQHRNLVIEIPEEDREEFEDQFLDHITAGTGWVSPDSSFTPGEPAPPVLRATVTAESWASRPPVVRVNFAFAYGQRLFSLSDDHSARRNHDAEVQLLENLGFEPVDREYHGVDVFALLSVEVPRWQAAGVEVVFDDLALELSQMRETTDVQVALEAGSKDRDWFSLQATVCVEGVDVPMAALIEALNRPDKLLFLGNGIYVVVDNPDYQAFADLLEEARALTDPRRATAGVPGGRTTWWDELESLEAIDFTPDEWLAQALSAARAPQDPVSVPDSLNAKLRTYQEVGFRWLAGLARRGLGGVLADDMGLGKTLQVLTMILAVPVQKPWLVVAPTSVVGNWMAEAEKFAPSLNVAVITATAKKTGLSPAEAADGADIVVTSYALLRLEADDYAACEWAGVVLDEAQNVKNPTSKAFQAVRNLHAPRVFAITGTPIENSLSDAWSMLSLTNPGLLGGVKQFRDYFEKPVLAGDQSKMDALRKRVAPFLLRRRKADVALDLPPIQQQIVPVKLEPSHRKLYDLHLARERQRVMGLLAEDLEGSKVEVLAALTRLRQLAIDPTLVEPESKAAPSKLNAFLELVGNIIAEGHRVLVFSQFTSYLRKVRQVLAEQQISASYLDGTTRDRATVIKDFTDGNDPVFLISLKAGGVGLNLTAADYVILLDPWWNPAAEQQAIDRAHRIGQTLPVTVFRLVSSDTIEDKVVALQESKRELMGAFLDPDAATGQTGGVELDEETLRHLFSGD